MPITGTIESVSENVDAAAVHLSDADLAGIDARPARLSVRGARGSGRENYG